MKACSEALWDSENLSPPLHGGSAAGRPARRFWHWAIYNIEAAYCLLQMLTAEDGTSLPSRASAVTAAIEP